MISNELLISEFAGLNIIINEETAEKFDFIAEELVRFNEKINVTAITDPDDIVRKHFVDSAAPVAFGHLKGTERIIDVGTGAGFPALPLALCLPGCAITAVDGVEKKLGFVRFISKELGLNCAALHERAESLGRDPEHREKYDAAVSRAVASLRIIEELTIPLVKVGGVSIIYKSEMTEPEQSDGLAAAEKLCAVLRIERYEYCGKKKLIVAEKQSRTGRAYPRSYSAIKNNLP